MRQGHVPVLLFAVVLGLSGPVSAGLYGERAVLRGLDLFMPVPERNPLTAATVALGRRLFFDRHLSRDGKLSCSSCHDPARAFTDGQKTATGIGGRRGIRNVPTLVNRGYGASFFWDGRASSLESQALEPIRNARELGSDPTAVIARLTLDVTYRVAFKSAFGRTINEEDLGNALASFVRTIQSGDSPVDRFRDRQPNSLTDKGRKGFSLFNGKANCWLCHSGPTFSDERFHNTGVAWNGRRFLDPGRAAITGRPVDRGAFKTPTLREVARTAPYMHDGSFATLKDVIEFYNGGGRPNSTIDPDLKQLRLSMAEKDALLDFLTSLTGTVRDGLDE